MDKAKLKIITDKLLFLGEFMLTTAEADEICQYVKARVRLAHDSSTPATAPTSAANHEQKAHYEQDHTRRYQD